VVVGLVSCSSGEVDRWRRSCGRCRWSLEGDDSSSVDDVNSNMKGAIRMSSSINGMTMIPALTFVHMVYAFQSETGWSKGSYGVT